MTEMTKDAYQIGLLIGRANALLLLQHINRRYQHQLIENYEHSEVVGGTR